MVYSRSINWNNRTIIVALKEKQFGISSSYRFLISGFTKKLRYFNYNSEQDA